MIVTVVGHGMRWTRQRRRANGIAGQAFRPVSEHPPRRRTALFFVFGKASADGYQTRRSLLAKADGAYGKTVWSWHPLLMLNLRRFCSAQPGKANPFPLMTVARRIRRRGERGISRKTIARGKPGDFGATVVTTVCLLPLHAGCGCLGHPAFPAPSVFEGRCSCKPRAPRRRGTRSRVPDAFGPKMPQRPATLG